MINKIGEEPLRIDDYWFYGRICQILGIVLLLLGIALPILTGSTWTDYFGTIHYILPYLGSGIALVVIGIILIVISQIIHREYRFKIAEDKTKMPPPPPP